MIQSNISLKAFNTFGINTKTKYLAEVENLEELKRALTTYPEDSIYILGGGSNILFTQDFDGLIIKIALKGIEILKETPDFVWLEVGAGENWHQFVLHCLEHNYAGIENLSLIPGTVGAAPMQNIGAYGVEVQDVLESVNALNRKTLEVQTFTKEECQLGYRESIFKNVAKDQFVITSVVFRLNKKATLNISYGALQDTLKEFGVSHPSIQDISKAVIHIRQSKLPDPAQVGNGGSFFKNPIISQKEFEQLQLTYPKIPHYPATERHIKIPAAWLIDQAGWKGHRRENIGVHTQQALVLVNYGEGKGSDIKQLSEDIQHSVFEKYNIKLHPEINIL